MKFENNVGNVILFFFFFFSFFFTFSTLSYHYFDFSDAKHTVKLVKSQGREAPHWQYYTGKKQQYTWTAKKIIISDSQEIETLHK